MSNFDCPVCSAGGLPDYNKYEVVCHQCDSNLKAFLLLDSIASNNAQKKGSNISRALAILLFFILCAVCLKFYFDKRWEISNKVNLISRISNLEIEKLQLEEANRALQNIESTDVTVKYVVKKGDCPYKIARFFYGNGNEYKKIEVENKLEQPYTLKVGQILSIKIVQD